MALSIHNRLRKLGEALVDASEKHRRELLISLSAIYLIVVGLIAARKPLENDELFTLNIARLPTLADVWGALLTGAEQLPPFFYVLTRVSMSLFGESSLSLRLPAVVGFWLMSVCLFRFVAARSTVMYGLAAMLFTWTTGAYYYAFEARPYGLVLGFAGAALVCHQAQSDARHRVLPVAGFVLSLAAAIACHYYAVLILLPFAFGEAVRAIRQKRVDVVCWGAIAASLAPLLVMLPLIRSASSSGAFWSPPTWGHLPGFYYFMLKSSSLPIASILMVAALYTIFRPADSSDVHPNVTAVSRFGLPGPEVAVAIGFLTLPLVGVVLAMVVTGAFTDRYVLPAVLGLGILMPFAFHPLLRGRDVLTVLLVFFLAAGFARRGGMTLEETAKWTQARRGIMEMLETEPEKDLPIVCTDPHSFLIFSHYAPPKVRSRLIYLADPDAALRHLGHNSIERGMLVLLKPWFRLNVQEYRSYVNSGRPFLLSGDPGHFLNWLLPDLVSSGASLALRNQHERTLLFLVSFHRQRATVDGTKRADLP